MWQAEGITTNGGKPGRLFRKEMHFAHLQPELEAAFGCRGVVLIWFKSLFVPLCLIELFQSRPPVRLDVWIIVLLNETGRSDERRHRVAFN